MTFFIGLDVGTSSVKAIAMDEHGGVEASASRDIPLHTPRPGWAEQDPEDWWRGAREAISEVVAKTPGPIAGLGLTGQMHGAVFLDARDEVIRPAILWNDQRTAAEADEITRAIGPEELQRITANPALTGFQAPKILWLRRHEPGHYGRVARVLLPKDYIRLRLTGDAFSDVSDASGTTLFNVAERHWATDVMRRLDLDPTWFPEAVESPAVAGRVRREIARDTGLPEGIPVCGGGGDQAAGAVGAGIVCPGVVSSTLGTSGVVFAFADRPWTDPQGRIHTFCHAVPGAWHVMGVILSAGGALRWLRDVLGYAGYDEMNAEAARVPPGSEGLIFLPYLTGERTPHKDPDARGVFFGLTLSHTRGHLARAVMEGVAFAHNDSFEIFRELNVPMGQVRAAGGGARSQTWLQIQADVTGLPHHRMNVYEGPSYGAAILAGVCSGTFASVPEVADRFVVTSSGVEPDEARHSVYREAFALYRTLYDDLRSEFPRAAALPA